MGVPVDHEDAQRVLDQLGVLRHRSDLDLLIFFARHPRALLTSDQLAAFLGYELTQIAASLDLLLDAKFLTRTQNRAHAARLYVFAPGETPGDWVPTLLKLASTREGRLMLLSRLSASERTKPEHTEGSGRNASPLRPARPVLVRTGDATSTKVG